MKEFFSVDEEGLGDSEADLNVRMFNSNSSSHFDKYDLVF